MNNTQTANQKSIVIFGASGNLSTEKIFPALFQLHRKGILFDKIIGYSRQDIKTTEFKEKIKIYISEESDFFETISYVQGSYDLNGLKTLKHYLAENIIFYFALPTTNDLILSLLKGIDSLNLIKSCNQFVFEKPIGKDFKSAQNLINILNRYIPNDSIYFVDHYLAKNMIRNIISLRFANPIFQQMWSNKHLLKIDIDILESDGVKSRGHYYDSSGAIRDVIQNHGLQLLSLLTMQEPEKLTAQMFIKEKLNILSNLAFDKEKLEIGQYKGYRKEKYVNPNSLTETYSKITSKINTSQLRNVPITITTGKKLSEKKTEIKIYFRQKLKCLWGKKCKNIKTNILTINIYPEFSVKLRLNSSFDPSKALPDPVNLNISFKGDSKFQLDSYSKVLKDVYDRERIYMPSAEEILVSWKLVDNVLEYIDTDRKTLLTYY